MQWIIILLMYDCLKWTILINIVTIYVYLGL